MSREAQEENEVIYWLCQFPFLGPATIRRMREHAGSFRGIYNIEGMDWAMWGVLKEGEGEWFQRAKKDFQKVLQEYHSLEARGIKFITCLDQEYPRRLKPLPDAPTALFVRGGLPREDQPSLGIIGSRNATQYGLEVARYFGKELARNGVQIISGLAAGVDGAGQTGALEGGGCTYGILGCGINICYPRENYGLFERVVKSGGIITEFCLGEPPRARNFPIRNRIISGLSDGIFVAEARERSGSLITVGLALEQGKDVFALPGRITDPGSRGCNQLIQTGASLVNGPGDILEFFSIKFEKKLSLHEKSEKGLAKKEKMLYSFIDLQPKHLEDIVNQSGLPLSECMMILLELELSGLIQCTGGNYYGRKLS